jgi:hypothetical protein
MLLINLTNERMKDWFRLKIRVKKWKIKNKRLIARFFNFEKEIDEKQFNKYIFLAYLVDEK